MSKNSSSIPSNRSEKSAASRYRPRKPHMKKYGLGTVIGIIISAVLIILLSHPQWILKGESASSMKELILDHFLIERSSPITFSHILTLILAMCVVWLVCTVLSIILNAIGKKNDRAATITTLLLGVLKYLAVIIAVIWGLSILGVDTTAVLAGLGIVGLIIGFGAQSLIEDIITGFFIIFEGQYRIGDIIVIDDFRGVVREIGVRTTTLEDAGYNLKVVNNSDIRNLQNRSRKNSLAICLVGVSYSTDLKALEKMVEPELLAMYEANKDLYISAPQYYGVEDLADSGVILKFVVPCKEVNVFAARRRLNRDIRVLFDEKDVEIPFPQVVVHNGD